MLDFLKKHNNKSFLGRLSFILWIFILIPFCIVIINYSLDLAQTRRQDIESRHRTTLSNFSLNFDKMLSSTTKKLDFIFNYQPLNQTLNITEKQNTLESVSQTQELSLAFDAITNSDFNISLNIYSDNENIYIPKYFHQTKELKNLDHFENIDSLEKSETYYTIQKGAETTLSIYRKYNDINKGYAVIELAIPCYQITSLLTEVDKNVKAYLELDGVFYDLYNWDIIEEKPTGIIFNKKIQENSSTAYLSIPKSTYSSIYIGIFLGTLCILIIFCICLFLFTRFAAWLLTQKLYEIIAVINEDALLELDTNKIQKDEFGIILHKLSEFRKELEIKSEQENQYIKKMNQLEMNILQERMSPHFLYNTLASIKWIYSDAKLGKLIDSIANYYRIMLNSGSSLTTIGDELDGIREYLTIQRFAYAKEFDLLIDCDDSLKGHRILKNIMQPIVENAFLHGINLSQDNDKIKISVLNINNNIVFRITNSGPPISQQKIDEINSFTGSGIEIAARHGYALKNTVNRIHLYYGKDYGIKAMLIDGLTTFDITIPYENTDEKQQ